MSLSVNIHPKSFEALSHESGTTWVNIDTGNGWAVIFLDSAKCDELIRAAVDAKRLLLGEDIPPALEQDLAQADADPANSYGGQAKHGEFTATSAAEVAEDVEPK